jgi:pimeloyl-ACP methyl ester carboxylesterase
VIRAAALAAAVAACTACGSGARHTATRLHCSGHGAPTILLEAGLDATHFAWANVQPALAQTTRTCSYDRLRGARRTAGEDVADLAALAAGTHLRKPYVLVGHSFGGILAYLYAVRHPRQVAGAVLVDSETPWQRQAFLVALGRPRRAEPVVAKRLRTLLARPQPNREGIDVAATMAEAAAANGLGHTPLVVIEAGLDNSASLPPRFKFLLDRTWFRLQARLAGLSSEHIHVVAPTSGHDVIGASGEPDLVVAAVRAVVRSVRTHTALWPCADLFARFAAQCVSG